MRLSLLNQITEYNNEPHAAELMLSYVDQSIQDHQVVIVTTRIDGQEVDDLEQYITDHLQTIQEIEIDTRTIKELIAESLQMGEEYITTVLPQIRNVAEVFYVSPLAGTWTSLGELLEGLQWLNKLSSTIANQAVENDASHSFYLDFSDQLQAIVSNLMGAMGRKDFILIGDLLKYELLPLLEQLHTAITQSIASEATNHDLT